jgi:D-alanyl-D-alanine carboxypeptidase/D-alanyl-D-alanine-endopeptidase (penicillin-binding protein 4)
VRVPYERPVRLTFHDPPQFFADMLRTRFERAGVRIGAARLARPDEARADGYDAAPPISTPIETVVTRCNRDSQNLYAESLLKRAAAAVTGEPGSWAAGGAVLRRRVRDRLGPGFLEGLQVADGSGLSRGNRVTASLVTAWLAEMHADEALSEVYLQSLAVAGSTGTLEKRFAGVDLHGATVRAKTGYINAVSCLSGYVTTPDGRTMCFSVLVNGLVEPGSVVTAKRLQERIVGAVAQELGVVPASLGSD